MSETKTIARPYANACFEVAKTDGQTEAWLLFLEAAATVVQDDDMLNLVKSPGIDKEALNEIIFNIANKAAGVESSTDSMNFMSFLSQNGRLDTFRGLTQ